MRFIWVLLLGLIIIGIGVSDEILLHKTFNSLERQATAIYTELEDNGITETSTQKIEKLNRFWTKRQDSMSLFIHNEETKFLSDRIATLQAYMLKDMKDEARVEANILFHEISLLRRQYRFTITNIL